MLNHAIGQFVCADPAKCTGCKACEIACFTVHNRKSNQVGYTIGTVNVPVTPKLYLTQGPSLRMPIQCKHCEDSPCKQVCQQKAISRQNGAVVIDESKCIGCKDCMLACPFGAITLLPYSQNGAYVMQPDGAEVKKYASKCDLCFEDKDGPACVRVCPNNALRQVDVEMERKQKNIRSAEALSVIVTNIERRL